MLSCSVLLLSRLPTEFDVATDVETPLEIARSDDAPSTTDGAHPLRHLALRPLSAGRRPHLLRGTVAPAYEVSLAAGAADAAYDALEVVATLRGAVRLHLNTDRSGLHRGVDAHDNQTYVVRLRFAGSGGGWHWDETLRVEAGRPAAGYHGHHAFERAGVVLAPGENVTVSVVQADWLGVTLGDWRALHAVLWELELCGVPRSPNENVSYTDAPTGDLAAHYGWAVDAFGNLVGVS